MNKELVECLCCGASVLVSYLNLGIQPLANSYHKNDIDVSFFPLCVNVCTSCFHNQLSLSVDPNLMFRNYLYVSGTTQTFRNHCRDLAEDAVRRYRPNRVLDIAANDGTLLSYFKDLGCKVVGVDPANNLKEISVSKGIYVIVDYWREQSEEIVDGVFDVITGTNVFAHVSDPYGFLRGCYKSLTADGVVILEFPYCDKLINHIEFDTIYHEHISYFLVNSFSKLVERSKFHIEDIIETPIHGGSIRFFIKKGSTNHCKKAYEYIINEKYQSLLNVIKYKRMAELVEENKVNLRSVIDELKKDGYKVIGYGASAKGNTMLNYFELKLDYIVDDNPMKWEYFTPGQNIIIKSPRFMADDTSKLGIVILSWNFLEEIKQKIKNIRQQQDDRYILYVPKVSSQKL